MARVKSWLDLGVLKALGGEARYRRVDATLMLLAANDTNVRRLWIWPVSAATARRSLRFRAGQRPCPSRNLRLRRAVAAETSRTTNLLVLLHPPAATKQRVPRFELGRVLIDLAAAPSLAAHDGCPSDSPSWTAKNHEALPVEFSVLCGDTRVSGCARSCPDLAFRCAHELLIDRRLARFDRSFEFESWYFTA